MIVSKTHRLHCILLLAAALCGLRPAAADDGQWSIDASGDWETPANWLDNTIADGPGHTARFTHGITADRTVTLVTPRSIGNLDFSVAGDPGRSRWVLQGNTLTLAGAKPTVTTTTDAVIASAIAGTHGFTKAGPGGLTLAGPVGYSGPTVVEAGVLRLESSTTSSGAPLGFWPMTEGSGSTLGNIVDGSPNGTLFNSPAWVQGPGGPGTSAVQFNGTTQYGEIIPNAAIHNLGSSQFSISAWVKTSHPGIFYRSLVTKYGQTGITPFWGLGWSATDQLGFVARNPANIRNQAHTGTAALDNTWQHLTGVREADNTMRIYLNGSLFASVAGPSGSMANNRRLQICRHLDSYVPASVAGVGVWDRALTAQEIAALYLNGGAPVSPPKTPIQLAAGATLELGSAQSVASLADHNGSGGTVALGGHILTIGDDTSTVFSGAITGTGGLIKHGSGTLTLAGHSTHTGAITVAEGALEVAGSLPAGTDLIVHSGALFELPAGGILRFQPTSFGAVSTLGGHGEVSLSGTFEIDLSAASTIPGNTWTLVAAQTLESTSYTPETFNIPGFTEDPAGSGIWRRFYNGWTWTFDQSNGTLTTQPVIALPSVENRPAVPYTANSVSLRGKVTASGFENPQVTLYYGTTDGGTDPTGWHHAADLGEQPGDFSKFVGGLPPSTIVYFRSRAGNSAGATWAPNTLTHNTPAGTGAEAGPIVLINEFVASNRTTLADEDGDYPDWIELHNPTGASIDLGGWGLSDSPGSLFQWSFPAGTKIPANGYLIVFASNKDRINPAAPLHTNFSISASGEPLILTRPDGTIADQTDPVVAPRDLSYGRTFEDPTLLAFLADPTPGAANDTAALPARLESILFSHPAGLHNQPFDLTLGHPDPEATIIYTLDGSEPDLANLGGTTYQFRNSYNSGPLLAQTYSSLTYAGPISISDRSSEPNKISIISSTTGSNPSYLPFDPVKKATVVRAKAYSHGAESGVSTATYFVSADGAFDWEMPIVSLSLNEDRLFDYHQGIYVAGVDHVTSSGGRICNWANFNRRGREAERPAVLQYFDNHQLVVDQNVGIRIHGNCSRMNAFKSFRINARRDYDVLSDIDYAFFPETVPHAIHPDNTLNKRLVLRAPNINELTFSRLFQPVYEGIGGRLRPSIKFLNGEYWGICLVRDRLDENYLGNHFGIDPDHLAMVNIKYGHEVGVGSQRVFNLDTGIPSDMDDFWAMRNFIIAGDMADPSLYTAARDLLDMASFIDHLILKIFAGDDHYAPEYIFWRSREAVDEHFGDSRWRVLVKDFDSTLQTANYVAGLATGTHPRSFGFELFQSLLQNESFRHDFINRFADLLNAHFLPERFQEVINHSYDEVAPYWNEMTQRWNNVALSNPSRPFTAVHRNNLLNWSTLHPPRQRQHIRQHFGISADANLMLHVSDPSHGHIRVNSIDINGDTPGLNSQPYPWTGIYFQGIPVRLEARPMPGYRLAGWRVNGAPDYESTASIFVTDLSAATQIEAEFEKMLPLHRWTFDGGDGYLNPAFGIGGGSLHISEGPETLVLQNAAAQGFDSAHLRINSPLGSTMTFALPTSGYTSILISYETRRSGQGAEKQTLSYTVDGSTWLDWSTYDVFDAAPETLVFDFTTIPTAEDNPHFAARITFAQGDGGLSGNHRFDNVVVSGVPLPGTNLPPLVTAALPQRIDLVEGTSAEAFPLAAWFEDPDGDPLVFTAASSVPGLADASVAGSQLLLTGLQRGETLLVLTAADGRHTPLETTVRVLVHPAAHILAGGPLFFGEWSADTAERVYPPHMLFLRGPENDSSLTTELDHAYHIPHDDYAVADLGTVGFPYNNSARTRINGLGQDGIAFINTGRQRDLGGTLLALDTSGLADGRVGFTAGTVLPNTRIQAIRLQYRVGTTGPFTDLLDGGGQPIDYVSDATTGHSQIFGPIDLPPAVLNQPYVQLLWRYYLVSGSSGPRAQLRLDDLIVSSEPSSSLAEIVFDNPPGGAQSGGPLGPVTVRLQDADGFPAVGFNGPVTLSLVGDGSLGGTLTVNAVNGTATFADLVLTGAGAHQLSASAADLASISTPVFRSLALSELVVPQFIQGEQDALGENHERVPFAWQARIDGLVANATYRFGNRVVVAADAPDNDGAGNMVFVTSATENWLRTTSSPRFLSTDLGTRHHTFTADGDGSFTGWFITEPSGNARFTPGNSVWFRLLLNDGDGGEETAHILTTGQGADVIRFGTASIDGTAIIGQTSTPARRLAVLYADADGTTRPLAATPVEITGAGTDARYAAFYQSPVATTQSLWGTILPNALTGGLRRIEIHPATDSGPAVGVRIAPAGFAGTHDPSAGLAPILLDPDAGLSIFLPGTTASWHTPANWSTGSVPDAVGAAAIVNPPAAADRDVDVNAAATVGSLRVNQGDTPHRNRLRTTAAGTFTFDGGNQSALLRIEGGEGDGHVDFDFNTGVTLATDLVLLVNQARGNPQYGALRLQQSWAGPGGLVKRGPGMASLTGEGNSFTGPMVIEQGVLQVTGPAVPAATSGVAVLPGGQLRIASTGTAEEPLDHHFGGGTITLAGMGRGGDLPPGEDLGAPGALRFDPGGSHHVASLANALELSATTDIHVDGALNTLILNGSVTGAFGLIKTGGGTLVLAGESTAAAPFLEVQNGTVAVTGSHLAAVGLAPDGVLAGSGVTGAITGPGTISPGTATLTAPSSTAATIAAVLATPGGLAGNGALALTGADPLPTPPSRIDLLIDHPSPVPGDRFSGGVLVPSSTDLASALAATDVRVFLADPSGTTTHLGQTYREAVPTDLLLWEIVDLPEGRTIEVMQGGSPSGFAQWRNLFFDDAAERGDDTVSGPGASAAGDGTANLLRYALGLGPHDPVEPWSPRLAHEPGTAPVFSFAYDSAKADLVWIVRGSPDLDDWNTTLFDSRHDAPPAPAMDGWTEIPVPATESRLFLRLEVSLGDP